MEKFYEYKQERHNIILHTKDEITYKISIESVEDSSVKLSTVINLDEDEEKLFNGEDDKIAEKLVKDYIEMYEEKVGSINGEDYEFLMKYTKNFIHSTYLPF